MTDFLSGIIEGFYGRPWPDETRLAYAGYLASLGLNTAVYCPKGDPCLRKQWQTHWPESRWQHLRSLADTYRERNIQWGPGLSPFALYQHYGEAERRQLKDKISRLQELQPSLIAILFDDMPGELKDLAGRQARIVEDVCRWAPEQRILVCPTYYSLDPVLEKYFGTMPRNYWSQLGQALPEEVGVFWTGNKVCSESVAVADIEGIYARLQRPVLLWDNYPVNDGALRSRHLYCHKLAQRERGLRDHLAGHLCNPMNQAMLSLPALAGLAELYGSASGSESWLRETLGEGTWDALRQDRDEFRDCGLEGMDRQRRTELAGRYGALPGEAALEVAGWLRGEYTFDPACLTD